MSRIDTAHKDSPAASVYEGGGWFETFRIGFPAILVRHPAATLLIDTGLGIHAREQFAKNPFWWRAILSFEQTASTRAVLDSAEPELDIDLVVPTHLHWDHASGLPDFPDAEVYVTFGELDYARTHDRPQVVAEEFAARQESLRYIAFDNGPYETFEASHDIFGDGRVIVVPLPGHTPGSIGVFVNLDSGRRLFFSGDLTWSLEALKLGAEKPWFTRRIVDSHRKDLADSMSRVRALMRQHPELIVLPAHDQAAMEAALPEFPDALD